MSGAHRGAHDRGARGRGGHGRGAAYWLSLLIGCLVVVVVGGLIYYHFVPQQAQRIIPRPTYSHGQGGLYDPGATLIPNPPTAH